MPADLSWIVIIAIVVILVGKLLGACAGGTCRTVFHVGCARALESGRASVDVAEIGFVASGAPRQAQERLFQRGRVEACR